MTAARLRSRARKHYNMRSVLRGIFWITHNVLCMGGAAGDSRTGRTIQFAHTCTVYVGLAQARPKYIASFLIWRFSSIQYYSLLPRPSQTFYTHTQYKKKKTMFYWEGLSDVI